MRAATEAQWAWSERQTGQRVKQLRSDGGPEYSSNEFKEWLTQHGIRHEKSAPDNQWQNGIAERAHRSLMEMALSMLTNANMARRWWAEAVRTVAFIQNRVLHTSTGSKTPLELLTGRKPTLANMKVFGCIAYNMVKDPTKRDKLAPKATKCVMLGYCEDTKAYKLYDLPVETQKVTSGVHVTFSESEFANGPRDIDHQLIIDDDEDEEPASPPVEGTPRHNPSVQQAIAHSRHDTTTLLHTLQYSED
ncbi:hypothetical protein AaE_015471 [Aphanomyces astaci]|uniref:Integrase catalytic domain-containing protein n=1 Tax=Aphanomyces astaci TaxID=112090 RepID=A0A6A4Z097_APHAT|nr:hypothetical protein AaE_015471 [Aphanomyces astaci]